LFIYIFSLINKIGKSYVLFLFLVALGWGQDQIQVYTSEDSVVVYGERFYEVPRFGSIATKSNLPLFQLPANIGVVTGAMMENQNNIFLGEALNNISGVNPQTGLGIHDYFIIRGFNSLDNGLILMDGIMEPGVPIYNLYNIEQVELLKGPGAFLYGARSLSGIVNLMAKRPLFENFVKISGNAGSYKSLRGTVDMGISNLQKGVAARINGLGQSSTSYRNDKENSVYAFNPTVLWQPHSTVQLNIYYEYMASHFKPDAGLPLIFDPLSNQLNQLPEISRKTSFQTPYDKSEQELHRFKVEFVKKLNPSITLQNRLYYNYLGWSAVGTILNGAFPTIMGNYVVSRSHQLLDDVQQLVGNQLELKFASYTDNFKNELLAGIEINRLTDDFNIDIVSDLPPLDLNHPVETYLENSIQPVPYQFGEAKSSVIAPYLLNILSIKNNLRLYSGGRYDMISFEEDLNNTNREYHQFSPMLGINYSFLRNTAIYVNAGKAFAPPSSRILGNPEAEKSKQIELGLKRNWFNGKIRSTVAFYSLEKENIAIPVGMGLSKQIGSQRSRGVEFEVTGQMSEKCASLFSYSYTDAILTKFAELKVVGVDDLGYPVTGYFDRTGNTASFAPAHMFNFWHSREIGTHFGCGAGIRYVSQQYIAEDNIFKINDYFVADASAYFKTGKFRWSLNLKNITDSDYELRGFSPSSVIPAMPFAVYGGFEIKY
jgi:iron complex outermembrane receptor protein